MKKDKIQIASNQTHTSKIVSWGNSHGIRLSKGVLRLSGLSVGDEISLTVNDKNQIVIERSPEADDGSLAYLFRDYKSEGKREPLVDFGVPVGNEIDSDIYQP